MTAGLTARGVAVAAAVAVALALPPLGEQPAAAGFERKVIASCPSGPSQCWPTAFAFTPNGNKIFYVERFSGQVRVFTLPTETDRRWTTVPNVEGGSGETGLLGIALDPRWSKGFRFRWVYLYYTHESPFENRIIRKRKLSGGGIRTDRVADIPAGGVHNGGVIHFGPDGKLYAVTGETGVPSLAQEKKNRAGKLLRMRRDGKRPVTNPWAGSLAWSRGHRNSFGFTFDPETGNLWQLDNGPECEDEANLVVKGGNYGWGGASECPNISESGPDPIGPEHEWTPTIAPTGAAFCDGCELGFAANRDLLVGSWNDGQIRRLVLSEDRTTVTADHVAYDQAAGILAVEAAPDGRLYFSDPSGIYRLVQ